MINEEEKIQELVQYLDCISKEIDEVERILTTEQFIELSFSPCIVDLSVYDFSSTIEGRRHIELLLVDLRRFFDKVVVTYCQIKHQIAPSHEQHISFPFGNSQFSFNEKIKKMNLPTSFQESKLYEFITSIQKHTNNDDELIKTIGYLNEVYRTSHRGVTKTDLKADFAFDFGGVRFSPKTHVSNCSFLNSDGGGTLDKMEDLGNEKIKLEYTSFGNFRPRLSFNAIISYKDKEIILLLREVQTLTQNALQHMRESI